MVNGNGIFIYKNLSLGVNNQKQINFLKLKMLLLFNGSLNTLRCCFLFCFFYSPGMVHKDTLSLRQNWPMPMRVMELSSVELHNKANKSEHLSQSHEYELNSLLGASNLVHQISVHIRFGL